MPVLLQGTQVLETLKGLGNEHQTRAFNEVLKLACVGQGAVFTSDNLTEDQQGALEDIGVGGRWGVCKSFPDWGFEMCHVAYVKAFPEIGEFCQVFWLAGPGVVDQLFIAVVVPHSEED